MRVSRREDVRVPHQKDGGTEAYVFRLRAGSSCIRHRVPSAPAPVNVEHTASDAGSEFPAHCRDEGDCGLRHGNQWREQTVGSKI